MKAKYKLPEGLIEDLDTMLLNEVAEKYGYPIHSLRAILSQNHISIYKRQDSVRRRRLEVIAKKYRDEFEVCQSVSKVAESNNVTKQYVSFVLRKCGYRQYRSYRKGGCVDFIPKDDN